MQRRSRQRFQFAIRTTMVLVLVSACGDGLPSPSAARGLDPVVAAPSSAEASLDSADVGEWVRFRQRYGLRSDLDHVLAVAGDPSTANEMSVPLLPAEIDAVAAKNLGIQNLIPALATYGETFGAEYAGTIADGARAVIRFTDRLDAHRADVVAFFGSDAPIDVQLVRYSLAELEAFSNQVEAERNWFATVSAELFGASPAELDNTVRVRYKAKDDTMAPAILDHFGQPEWMLLKWYGPLPWTGPRGTLRAMVVDKEGRPAHADCVLQALDPAAVVEGLPMETRDGICTFEDVPATDFQVEVSIEGRRTTSEPVTVPGNGTATVKVTASP